MEALAAVSAFSSSSSLSSTAPRPHHRLPPHWSLHLPSRFPSAAATTPSRMEALAAVSAFSSSCSLSSTAPRPHHGLLTNPASGRSTRTLLPPPRAVSSSRAPLVVSHSPPAPVAAAHAKVDHSGRFCGPLSARELALLCKGSELLDRILARGGKYSEEDAKVVMVQIFSVVSFCHLQGVVHRDLKPEIEFPIHIEGRSLCLEGHRLWLV